MVVWTGVCEESSVNAVQEATIEFAASSESGFVVMVMLSSPTKPVGSPESPVYEGTDSPEKMIHRVWVRMYCQMKFVSTPPPPPTHTPPPPTKLDEGPCRRVGAEVVVRPSVRLNPPYW